MHWPEVATSRLSEAPQFEKVTLKNASKTGTGRGKQSLVAESFRSHANSNNTSCLQAKQNDNQQQTRIYRARRRRRQFLASSINTMKATNSIKSISLEYKNNNTNKTNTRPTLSSQRVAILWASILISLISLVNCQTCQYQQQTTQQLSQHRLNPNPNLNLNSNPNSIPIPIVGLTGNGQAQNMIICPKSSQYNDMPHFVSNSRSLTLERHQRSILRHLNESFANHLQLNGAHASSPATDSPEPLEKLLMDDEMLNEIISPVVIDAAYTRAKEQISKRRKFENELVRQGEWRPLIRLADVGLVSTGLAYILSTSGNICLLAAAT